MLVTFEGQDLTWLCPGDEGYCMQGLHATLAEARYLAAQEACIPLPRTHPRYKPDPGAVIALPACAQCGTQTFLKADYSLRELFKLSFTIQNAAGEIWAYALPFAHMRNLRLQHALYRAGLAAYAPLLPEPPETFLPISRELACSLWYGFGGVGAHHPQLASKFLTQLLIGAKQ